MEWIPRLFAVLSTVFAVIALEARPATTPTQPPTPTSTTLYEAPRPLSVPSTTTAPAPPDALCPQWWPLARQVGWPEDELATLDYVMWRESRCLPTQHNTTLNADGSTDLGLTQINDWSWCLPTRWYPDGYLQSVGVLPTVGCEQLFDPHTNLAAAKAIYDYSKEANQNGWQPWEL